jgi:RES domain
MDAPMPELKLPSKYRGTPNTYTLNARERLWRVHSRHFDAVQFTPVPTNERFGGGRFDSTKDDPYSFYYAGAEQTTALAEIFLRDELRFNDWGYRVLPHAAVRGRRISAVLTLRALTLVSLQTGPDLAAVAMSPWLVHGGARYEASRAVARWLRARAPNADGLIWSSTIDLGKQAIVLFEDRCGPTAIRELESHPIDLDSDAGIGWLNEALAPYHTQVRPRRRRA